MNATPGYAVKHQMVAVAGGQSLQVRSLLDRQQFYDPHGEAEAAGIFPSCWPLFGQVWPSAQILIIDPNRGNRSAFNRCMAQSGFTLTETKIDAPLHDGTPYRGRLLHYRR